VEKTGNRPTLSTSKMRFVEWPPIPIVAFFTSTRKKGKEGGKGRKKRRRKKREEGILKVVNDEFCALRPSHGPVRTNGRKKGKEKERGSESRDGRGISRFGRSRVRVPLSMSHCWRLAKKKVRKGRKKGKKRRRAAYGYCRHGRMDRRAVPTTGKGKERRRVKRKKREGARTRRRDGEYP